MNVEIVNKSKCDPKWWSKFYQLFTIISRLAFYQDDHKCQWWELWGGSWGWIDGEVWWGAVSLSLGSLPLPSRGVSFTQFYASSQRFSKPACEKKSPPLCSPAGVTWRTIRARWKMPARHCLPDFHLTENKSNKSSESWWRSTEQMWGKVLIFAFSQKFWSEWSWSAVPEWLP